MPAKWVNAFIKNLTRKGHSLKLYDTDTSKSRAAASRHKCIHTDNLRDCCRDSELILLCTPIKDTAKVIQDINPHLCTGTAVCEISSIKSEIAPALRQIENSTTLSLHPMFGPDVTSFSGQTMVLVHVKDGAQEAEAAGTLFPETKLVQVSPESHDEVMAYVLSLPYFMNLAFAHTLDPMERDLMRELAGTTFKVQSIVSDCVVGESPELIESLIKGNVYSGDVVNQFIHEALYLKELLNKGDSFDDYCQGLQELVGDHHILEARTLRNKFVSIGDQS